MRSAVKTSTPSQTHSIHSRLPLSSVPFNQVAVCTSVQIILCLQDVVVDAVEQGPGAVTVICPRWAHHLALDLIQSVPLAAEASLAPVQVQAEALGVVEAYLYQAHSAETQTMTNSSRPVPEALEPLAEITRPL